MRGAPPPLRQHLLEKLAGEARFTLGAALRSSGVDKLAAHIAALGAEVDDVIRDLYDVEIVLDDDASTKRSFIFFSWCTLVSCFLMFG